MEMEGKRFRRLCAGIERLSVRQVGELQARLRGLDARIELRARVTDDAGVANSRATMERIVTVTPAPAAGRARVCQLDPGIPYPWATPGTAGIAARWSDGGGTATAAEIEHAFDAPGLYPVAVTLDDGRGVANSRRTE